MGATLGRTISVCAQAHAATWQRAAPNILCFIEAREHLVIVPDDEVQLFRRLTPGAIRVAPESEFVGAIVPRLRDAVAFAKRFGWYLQQFIKLSALLETEEETALLWDADTIPLRPLHFEDAAGRLRYYTSEERHDPYFAVIERLLGPCRTHTTSFVAQCFPIRSGWARDFAAVIETRSGRPWYEAIIAAIDFSEWSGFSEYETLGTYVLNTHASDIIFNSSPWLRRGTAAVGGPEALDAGAQAWLARRFDYAAFELWDRRPAERPMNRIRRGALRWLRGSASPE